MILIAYRSSSSWLSANASMLSTKIRNCLPPPSCFVQVRFTLLSLSNGLQGGVYYDWKIGRGGGGGEGYQSSDG